MLARIWRKVDRVSRAGVTRLQHHLAWPSLVTGPVRIAADFRHPIDAGHRSALIARYRGHFAQSAEATLENARQLLEHRFRFLGHTIQHGAEIAWSRDPVSGREWSRGFSPDIAYRGPRRLGDVKLPWELSKHQYFFILGKAAWLTDSPLFAREILTQIDHWIRDNPCHRGIHWTSALESGTRAISWILAFPFYADACDMAARERLALSLAQHFLFVERNLSVGKFANTHLVGEAAALAIGGLFLSCSHSKRWLQKGLHHMEEQMRLQVRSDGGHAEQSAAYHRFFMDQYHLVNAVLQVNNRSYSPATLRCLERMTEFLMDILLPDGSAPGFGDCDDARGIWCRSDAPRDYRSLLALGAVVFGRSDFKSIAGEAAEELLWLYGESALDTFENMPAHPPEHTSAAYPDTGYYTLRSGWAPGDSVLTFDCGPLGYGPSGHGHADALSFQLFAHSYAFLVDPGTYSYNLDYRWRDIFRSTRAHNTLLIDGFDQSAGQDRMSWSFMAQARCRRWLSTSEFDLVEGEHDGYRRLSDPVSHRRVVVFLKPDIWLIYDLLAASSHHEAEMFLHTRPDCEVELEPGLSAARLRSPGGHVLHVRSLQNGMAPARIEVFRGTDDKGSPIEYSEEYGCKTPSSAIRILLPFSGTATLLTAFGTRSGFLVESRSGNTGLDVTVASLDGLERRFAYDLGRADGAALLCKA
jgi:hypothetical protein